MVRPVVPSALLVIWHLSPVAGLAIGLAYTFVPNPPNEDARYQQLCAPFGRDPCAAYNILVDTCNGSYLATLDSPEVYPPLTKQTANACSCSLEGYNLMAACSYCQAHTYSPFANYTVFCTSAMVLNVRIANDLVPAWATLALDGNGVWDISGAYNVSIDGRSPSNSQRYHMIVSASSMVRNISVSTRMIKDNLMSILSTHLGLMDPVAKNLLIVFTPPKTVTKLVTTKVATKDAARTILDTTIQRIIPRSVVLQFESISNLTSEMDTQNPSSTSILSNPASSTQTTVQTTASILSVVTESILQTNTNSNPTSIPNTQTSLPANGTISIANIPSTLSRSTWLVTKTFTSLLSTVIEVTHLVTTKTLVTSTRTTSTNGTELVTQTVATQDTTKSIVVVTTQMIETIILQTLTVSGSVSTMGLPTSTSSPSDDGNGGDTLGKKEQIVIGVAIPLVVMVLGFFGKHWSDSRNRARANG